MQLQTIIVEDEPLASEILETYCNQYFSSTLQLIATCPNALDANKILKKEKVDLMFLDIQMPELSGLDFLRILDHPPLTILTTAHSEYAIQSYELDVVDYLLKPIARDRFKQAVQKAIELHQFKSVDPHLKGEEDHNFIFIKSDKKYLKIKYEDIVYIEGLKDYVLIYTDDQKIIALHTMKSLEEKLSDVGFRRIHRSYIANLQRVTSLVGNELHVEVDEEKVSIPIGKSYREKIHNWVDNLRL